MQVAHFVNANGLEEGFRMMYISLNCIEWERWWYFHCISLCWRVTMGPGSSMVEPISSREADMFQVIVIRTNMIFHSPSIIQTYPCYRLALEELKPIFSTTISQLLGPGCCSRPATLSQPLSLPLWPQTTSAWTRTSGWWSAFWSSSCFCSAHSAWPRAPGFYPCGSHELLLALLPWTSSLLLSSFLLFSFFDN